MTIFQSIGNAFKAGWNNGNIVKGFKAAGMAAMGGAMIGAMLDDSKNSGHCCGGSIFGGGYLGGGCSGNMFYNSYNQYPFDMMSGIYPSNFGIMGGGYSSNFGLLNSYMGNNYAAITPYNQQYQVSQQEDPFAACKQLYGEYNYSIVDGKYCCRMKSDNKDVLISASNPQELLNKIADANAQKTESK